MPGELELHQNGVRFCDPRDSNIDILFSNVKHLIYHPSDERGSVFIHLHLKLPILIGKKRFKDVQFYRKVPDSRFVEMESQGRKRRRLGEVRLALGVTLMLNLGQREARERRYIP